MNPLPVLAALACGGILLAGCNPDKDRVDPLPDGDQAAPVDMSPTPDTTGPVPGSETMPPPTDTYPTDPTTELPPPPDQDPPPPPNG